MAWKATGRYAFVVLAAMTLAGCAFAPGATDPAAAHQRAQAVLSAWADAVAAAGAHASVTPVGDLTGQVGDWEEAGVSQGLHQDWSGQNWALAIIYVVLAFLAQAAIGGALLQAEVLPPWIGWATVVWSLGWLLVFAVSRGDVYFPVLHHVMPLLIGVALILGPT